jgi:hypothetical protein
MRLTGWSPLFCVFATAFALGCAREAPEAGGDADDELVALTERANQLRERVAAAGDRPSAELRADFDELAEDARAWAARTGRTDIRTGTDSTRATGTAAVARDDGGGGDRDCASCPGYSLEGDKICFLTEEGPCPEPAEEGEFEIGPLCAYYCIWIGSGPAPQRAGEARD